MAAAAPALEAVVQQGRDLNVRVVAAVETQTAHRTFGSWLSQMQRDRQVLLLDPDPSLDGALAGGVRLPGRNAAMPPGRGYLVIDGVTSIIQVAGPVPRP